MKRTSLWLGISSLMIANAWSDTGLNREAAQEAIAKGYAARVEAEREVREAVRAEWQAVTGKYRARRRVTRFAIAASVLSSNTV